ncbi:unnamed protein product [Lactuca virosa]|uniref:Uncharacterized protein n=1 Tax=Lactuca virosa TaxID=75947 RepID=A0AAU9NAL6_9ASTR|nr:unnamed protein product [Lactuca virosa]
MGRAVMVPWSPLRLHGFGSDAFSIGHLVETSCPPLVIPSKIDFSRVMDVGSTSSPSLSRKRKRPLTPHHFEHSFCEVSSGPRCISPFPLFFTPPTVAGGTKQGMSYYSSCRNVILTVLGQEVKFFDGLFSLQDKYFYVEVSLQATKGMKLAGKEMLFKDGEMYAELDGRGHDVVGRVTMLEN